MRPPAPGLAEAGAPSEVEDDDNPKNYQPCPTKLRQETEGSGSAKRGHGPCSQSTLRTATKAL
jgi:hypothetical protein